MIKYSRIAKRPATGIPLRRRHSYRGSIPRSPRKPSNIGPRCRPRTTEEEAHA